MTGTNMNIVANNELRYSEDGEKLVGKYFPCLDKGFVGLVSYHGTDQLIEAAARTSYKAGTRKVSDSRNLIRYLIRNNHASPLEMPCCIFHLKMPLYVIQQLLRHRTAKLNQESHRYSEISYQFQKTGSNEWRTQAKNNKQGSTEGNLEWPEEYLNEDGVCLDLAGTHVWDSPEEYLSYYEDNNMIQSANIYRERLKFGVAKEQARKDIPHSTYSEMYWQMDLRNLLHFMDLRCDQHAQKEIRDYANVIAGMVQSLFPLVYEAWIDYSFCSSNFTRLDKLLLKEFHDYSCPSVTAKELLGYSKEIGMSSREFDEFWEKIEPKEVPDFTLDVGKAKDYTCFENLVKEHTTE